MTPTALTGLSATLQEQFTDWLERRKPQEDVMLRCYEDNMRISRDDDTKGTGISKAQKSRVFIGSTRAKIRSARAKIKDVMFGSGNLPFDVEPTSEDLKMFSDVMEDIVKLQLEEGRFRDSIESLTDAICVYGTGFNFGPFVKKKTYQAVEQAQDGGLQQYEFEYDCPYFENAQTMDCYPDPEAEDLEDGRGIYWAARKDPAFIRQLKGQDGYDDEAINRALTQQVTNNTSEGSDREKEVRQNLYRYTEQGRIWFLRYFGLVKQSELTNWKGEGDAVSPEDDELVEAIVIMAGGEVIKAEKNEYKMSRRPAYRSVYEKVEHEMWGVGIAENNEPHQRVTNAAFRLFVEGKAFSQLNMFSADRSKFETSEDFKLFPGKRFAMRPGLTSDERKEAITWHIVPDVTNGWEKVIEMSEGFSDDDTGITKYTQGTDSSNLNKTATGISMIMNASSLPLKEVIAHLDRTIEDMIERLIDWDLEYLEPKTVKVLLGQEKAEVWAKIKAYGKANFMEWYATGSATFMAKEVLANKLNGFLALVSGNEQLSQMTDVRELLEQVWDVLQIGKESPVFTEEDLQTKQNNPVAQKAEAMIQQVTEEAQAKIAELTKKLDEATAAYKSKEQELQIKVDKANDDRHALAVTLLQASALSAAQTEKTQAETDKIQAETIKVLNEAAIVPSPEMVAQAQQVEEDNGTDGLTPSGADAAAVDSGSVMAPSGEGTTPLEEPAPIEPGVIE
jgi:hypothetical protein